MATEYRGHRTEVGRRKAEMGRAVMDGIFVYPTDLNEPNQPNDLNEPNLSR